MEKRRLDLLLLERKLVSTRTKAQELVRDGKVKVNGAICRQPGEKVAMDAALELTEPEHPYVSRGGLKLAAALDAFSLSVQGKRVLDIGQSTGGFTHCLLLRGASEVVGIEVGHDQLAESLRAHPKVKLFERQDIRTLSPEAAAPAFSFCVADLSFISLGLVVPHLAPFLKPGADIVLLVKPQFEVGPDKIGSGGLVKNEKWRLEALQKVERSCSGAGFTVAGSLPCPLPGGDGNQEYLLHLSLPSSPGDF
jgi:23S rRNA (cytidine1920-2'-O)/16S rRNA (cytidine1409-2'-O)-methyltransferase